MIEIKLTNIKPEAWYNEYCVYLNQKDLDNDVIDCKKYDGLIDIWHIIHNHLAPFVRQMEVARLMWHKEQDKEQYKEQYFEASEQYYFNIPSGVNEEEFDSYHQLIRGKCGDKEIVLNYNTLEKNAKYLDFLIATHNNIKKQQAYKQLCSGSCKEYHKFLENRIKLCKQAIKKGYLITEQLTDFDDVIYDCRYCFFDIKKKWKHPHIQTLSVDVFKGFSYTDDQIFNLIRRNVKWRNIGRDITIFREIQKGKYQQELADKYGINHTTISGIKTRVQGAFNYWEGILLEIFVFTKLNQSGLFGKVVKEAGKGEADILTYSKDDKKLTIYSVKNIKINRKPYWLVVDELKPELARAKLQQKDYSVNLILLIYNNLTKQIKQYNIDYNNPVNIDISK